MTLSFQDVTLSSQADVARAAREMQLMSSTQAQVRLLWCARCAVRVITPSSGLESPVPAFDMAVILPITFVSHFGLVDPLSRADLAFPCHGIDWYPVGMWAIVTEVKREPLIDFFLPDFVSFPCVALCCNVEGIYT